ncbi:MAG: M1 family metallopeptidase [Cytophagaceae bacterium]|nr:M1 family metallopeptidase [Cytophagaceae bacterium]MDW8457111.1 M1 family metallopeptidase [Cytophagaceae bacterium]
MRILLTVSLIFQTLLLPAQKKVFSKYDYLRGALSPLRSCYDVFFYDLNLKIDINNKKISGYNDISFIATANFNEMQIDLFANMVIDSIMMDYQKLKFTRDSNATFVYMTKAIEVGNKKTLRIYYSGAPKIAEKPPWEGGFVWSKDAKGNPWVGVACEGIGASLWWPCKDHLSDEPDSMRMAFTVPAYLQCISNGTLRSVRAESLQYSTYEWFTHYPINNYNVTLNIGIYTTLTDSLTRSDKSSLKIDYYILEYNRDKALRHFSQVKKILTCYEVLFGRYPFEKDGYALVETPYWGMEHQSAIAYGNNYVNNMMGVLDYIIVHETGHEWWGNNLSVADHAEMWIHESFTTYAEALIIECMYGYQNAVAYLVAHRNKIKNDTPMLGPLNVNYVNHESNDIYYKGAWMLHTLRSVIANDSIWFDLLLNMQLDLKYSIVTTTHIVFYISKKTGTDYAWFFDYYLKQKNPPTLCYSTKKIGADLEITYKWENTPPDFIMPIDVFISPYERIRLYPTHQIKKSVLRNVGTQDIKIATDYFYINVVKK